MRVFIISACWFFISAIVHATPLIEGTYDCIECWGLLEIKPITSDTYNVELVVGHGSCGGEVIAKGLSPLFKDNELRIPYKSNKKTCTSKISLHNDGAKVSDSCKTAENEANSTCATLGEYSKRLPNSSSDQELETGLLNALKLDKKIMERLGRSGEAIQAYMRHGFINKKPNQRADYSDYYLIKKPTRFMGHDLVMIEEEYMTRYIGCCVSPGMSVTVKVADNAENLKEFANENGCTFSESVDFQDEISSIGIKTKTPQGNYASLSCKERDATR